MQLKDKASVSGTILAEKPNEIVIDIGYTVLVIPRNQILHLLNDKAPARQGPGIVPTAAADAGIRRPRRLRSSASTPASLAAQGFYSAGAGLLKERSVRELAAELGAAVVQVRTPGGLGSGFFINEDGFLITNFHVTEGETQISVEVFQQKNGELERQGL